MKPKFSDIQSRLVTNVPEAASFDDKTRNDLVKFVQFVQSETPNNMFWFLMLTAIGLTVDQTRLLFDGDPTTGLQIMTIVGAWIPLIVHIFNSFKNKSK